MGQNKTIWMVGVLTIIICVGTAVYTTMLKDQQVNQLLVDIQQQNAAAQNQFEALSQRLDVVDQEFSSAQPTTSSSVPTGSSASPTTVPPSAPPPVSLAPGAAANQPVVLYTDAADGIQVETTEDCKNVFSVALNNSFDMPGFGVSDGGQPFYNYGLLTSGQYQTMVANTISKGMIKLATLTNGLIFVAYQLQGAHPNELNGQSGNPCPLPIVYFNSNQSVQGFTPPTQ